MKLKRFLLFPLLLIAAGTLLAACGGSDSGSSVSVSDAWARSTPPGQSTSAIYATIEGGDEADRLVAVKVPAEVAGTAEIHETVAADGGVAEASDQDGMSDHDGKEGDGDGDHMADDDGHGDHPDDSGPMGSGTMKMRQLDGLDIPAGGEVELEAGGRHIMLMELPGPLEAGDTIPVTLTFEQAGEVKFDAEVRDD